MASKLKLRTVVIDADIARSAGTKEFPQSKNSREVLEAVRSTNLLVAVCPLLMREWTAHKSLFARQWLSHMFATRRVHDHKPTEIVATLVRDTELTEKEKEVAEKDCHLIDGALATQGFVTSNDVTAKKVFSKVALRHARLKNIAWIVPLTDGAAPIVEIARDPSACRDYPIAE